MKHKPDLTAFGSGKFLPLLVVLFIGSGCAALIYEVIWLQLLQFVVGATSLSLGVLLGTFMGGMCLGSLLLPRLVSIKQHPLVVYACLEIGIGLLGLAILYGMPFVENLYTGIAGYGLFQSILLRSLVAAICLLPPTILMGATLPAISRWVETTPKGISWMGFFYGGNIFGAVAGCILAGFYLLRIYDIAIATYVAVFLNVIVAIGAILVSRITPYNYDLSVKRFDEASPFHVRAVYITIALSGMAALGSEVIWTRILSIMLGSTVYTFSIILAEFLVGLGIGSAAGAYLSRSMKRPGFALGMCQFLLILAIAWTSYILTDSLPYRKMDLSMIVHEWYLFQIDLARSAVAVLPPAIFWGASFPLALAAVASKDQDAGRLVGRVYAANTVGAIIGAIAFSLIGIPVLGTAISQKLLVVISALGAILMFSQTSVENPAKLKQVFSRKFSGIAVGIIVLVGVIITNMHAVPWFAIAYGRYMSNYDYLMMLNKNIPNPDLTITPMYVGEGLNGSVAVTLFNGQSRQYHSMGKVQASTDPRDMRLQRMLGHITTLLTPNPESVLVVGCGAGITAGSFVTHPEVKNVTICEIEPLVPKIIAPMFSKENYGITDGIDKVNPHMVNGKKVKVEYDDGRHYISTSRDKFDIISADPIDPWSKGAAPLYSKEFFDICKAHLKPGGAMSLWVPLYETSLESVKSTISTFFKVFPNGMIWSNDNQGIGYDLVLFGQAEKTTINVDVLGKTWEDAKHAQVRKSLADVGFYNLSDLLGTYAGSAKDLKKWMADAQINTDRNLRLGYLAGMALNNAQAAGIFFDISNSYVYPKNLFTGSDERVMPIYQAIDTKMWLIQQKQINPLLQ